MRNFRITVGDDECDLRGFGNLPVQCALDRAAMLGGGEVVLSAGVFYLNDAIRLRSGVTLRGAGAATILRKNAMRESRVTTTLGWGFREALVENPELFGVGDGVTLRDDTTYGFLTTYCTLIGRRDDAWLLDAPLNYDIVPGKNGRMQTFFPMILAYGIEDAEISDLVLDGNLAENPWHPEDWHTGGVLAIKSRHLKILRLRIHEYNGEGISFQGCENVEAGFCTIELCGGNGIHPGGGSSNFHVHHCVARKNGWGGFAYCLRATDSILEDSVFEDNGWCGISLGSRNCRNVNRRLTVRGNGRAGIHFPERGYCDSSHHVLFENCTIEKNCRVEDDAEIVLRGEVDMTHLMRNVIRPADGKLALKIERQVGTVVLENNALDGPVRDLRSDEQGHGRTVGGR